MQSSPPGGIIEPVSNGSRPVDDDPATLLAQWPVGECAAIWVRADGSRSTFGSLHNRFRLASLTKPLFAYAVLVAAEEGTLPLERPLGPAGSTVAHLLAHASGLGPEAGDPVIPPAQRRIYSNAGFELLGEALTASSGFALAEYLREAVFEPLGMNNSALEGSPAHGAVSSAIDLMKFLGELQEPQLISSQTLARLITPAFGELSGVLPGYGMQRPNPWGLGLEIRGHKRPHWTGPSQSPETVGHFGAAGTFLWMDPASGSRAVVLTDTAFGSWAVERWATFNEVVSHGE